LTSAASQVAEDLLESGLGAGTAAASLLDTVWAEWPNALERF
jgi:hypothetical protein